MRLQYRLPGESLPLTEGTLVTEDGEEIEGVIISQVLRHGEFESVSLTFSLMAEIQPKMPEDVALLTALRVLSDVSRDTKED